MSSENKKRKAKNSFLMNGGEKDTTKLKGINYYKKRDRAQLKKELQTYITMLIFVTQYIFWLHIIFL